MGVPSTDREAFPELRLIDTTGDDDIEMAVNNVAPAGITNAIDVVESPALTCGSAGGCTWSAEVDGLASNIKAGQAEVQVCGK
jgi:hypothetical protein